MGIILYLSKSRATEQQVLVLFLDAYLANAANPLVSRRIDLRLVSLADSALVSELLRELSSREPWVLEPFQDGGESGPSSEAQAMLEALGYTGGGGQSESVWTWISISTGELNADRDAFPPNDCLPVLR